MKVFYSLLFCVLLSGCAHQMVGVDKVVVLPEEKIYTLKAGSPVDLNFDKQELKGTIFPSDMFVVSSAVLVRQEEKLNNLALDKIKSEKKSNKLITILGSVIGLLSAGFAGYAKLKSTSNKIT